MKCVISSRLENPVVAVRYMGNALCLSACLSSIFQQTILPRKVYVLGNMFSADAAETVRYFNEETVMRTEMASSVEALGLTDADGIIHVGGNVVMERRYVEKELKGCGCRMSVILSPRRTGKILGEIRKCSIRYVDIHSLMPYWIGLYSKMICWLRRTVCRCHDCQMMYILAV